MNLGIIGTGSIAKRCLEILERFPAATPTAILARDQSLERAQSLARQFCIPEIYTDADAFFCDPHIDAVYVGVINSEHHRLARAALLADKAVLCEKPLTCSAWQAEDLCTLAGERRLILLEAVAFLFSPNYTAMKACVDRLRDIKLVWCNYSQYSSRYDAYLQRRVLPAFDPLLGGGALYDINIYNLHLAVSLFGEPRRVEYHANIGFNGVDTSGVAMLGYDGFQAVCCGAKDSSSPCGAVVQASNGFVALAGPPNTFPTVTACIDGKTEEYRLNDEDAYMLYELQEFERAVRERDIGASVQAGRQSLAVMKVAELCRRAAGIPFPGNRV